MTQSDLTKKSLDNELLGLLSTIKSYRLVHFCCLDKWPFVPTLTAGALDRKAGLYSGKQPDPFPAHVRSRPQPFLTRKVTTCSSSTGKWVDFRKDRHFCLVRLYPYKREFVDPVAE